MAYLIGQIIGGLLITFLLSRLFLKLTGRRGWGIGGVAAAHLLSWLTIAIISGFGRADGGPFVWTAGLRIAVIGPQIFWLVWDIMRGKGDDDDPNEDHEELANTFR